jgi:hypothetical protein
MKEFVFVIVFVILVFTVPYGITWGWFRSPEDTIIENLVKVGVVKEEIVDHEVQHTLLDERFRPMIAQFEGWGVSFNGNVISH